jgi:uncharacterized protein YbjT (DUF2867 family)
MILVVGATGVVGRAIAARLLARGETVRALVRPGSRAADLEAAGADLVAGDLRDTGSLGRACRGADVVVTTANAASPRLAGDSPETVDAAGNAALFDAAKAAGVRQVVYVSAYIADAGSPVPFLRAKGRAELHLERCGVAWTILRPAAFMESWPAFVVGMPCAAGRPVRLPLPPVRRHSFVSADDVAALAAAVAGHEAAMGRRFDVGGPEAMTWADVARVYGEVLGREVPIEVVGLDGDLSPMSPLMVSLLAGMEAFDSIIDPAPLALAFGVVPTRLEEVVRRAFPAST